MSATADPTARVMVHATAIALGARAVLIRGPSGSGKSDLALRCLMQPPGGLIAEPAKLLADDQVEVVRIGARLEGRAPATLAGLIEVRGVGILTVPSTPAAEIALVVDIVPSGQSIERLPDPAPTVAILGVSLPQLRISPFESSAPAKLLLALDRGPGRTMSSKR